MADSIDAYRALWSAVILQLVADAVSTGGGQADQQSHAEALVWLRCRTRFKDDLIMRAGVDANAFWFEAGRGFPAFRAVMSNKQMRSAARRMAA